MKKARTHRGFTLAELCIALVLMSTVVLLSVSLLSLSMHALVGTELKTTVAREDAEFAAKLNESIRESGTAFTVPKNSFVNANLTAGWNYLGRMENVFIPAAASNTGSEIDSGTAIVYIEYAGTAAAPTVPVNANLIHTSDGYFIQHILTHDFTDRSGITHTYSLTFEPTDPMQLAAQSITYEFSDTLTDRYGNSVGTGSGIDIDTMLNSLNVLQIVYKGSETNPAQALAFRSDFLPTYSVSVMSQPEATVTLVLDLSGSMSERLGAGTRLSALKKSAVEFVEKLSANDNIHICLVPFSSFGTNSLNYSRQRMPSRFVYNAADDKAELISVINGLEDNGGTNVGDGLRRAYYELKSFRNTGTPMGCNFLVLMTDGAMNAWSINGNTASKILNFYTGSAQVPPYVAYNNAARSPHYIETGTWFATENSLKHSVTTNTQFFSAEDALERGARAYMRYWADLIMNEFSATTYLISLCSGMSAGDQEALQDAFGNAELFDVESLTEFQETFDQINSRINEVMWAFEGPRM